MILDYIAAITLWLSMITYAVLGGADFGGGFWDLFSLGAKSEKNRNYSKFCHTFPDHLGRS